MPGAYDLNPSSFSCFPDATPVPQKVATNAEDDDEIVLDISDDPKFHEILELYHNAPMELFEVTKPAPVQPEADAPAAPVSVHAPAPVRATNAAPAWLCAAAKANGATQGPGATPMDVHLAAAIKEGPAANASVKAIDPRSIFSPAPPPTQTRPRYISKTRYRVYPSIGQALPDSKASVGDAEDAKMRALLMG